MTTREHALAAAITVEIATVAWMFVEGGVSLVAGASAHSVALTAFGIDSIIELVTAIVLWWRLAVERNHGSLERVATAERRASWIVGVSLALLCGYVVLESGYRLWSHGHADDSPGGIAISVGAVAIMPMLARRKVKLARKLESAALRGDAACSVTCAYMAATLLVGLAVQWFTDWWWVDSTLALALLYWLVPESTAAIHSARVGKLGCTCEEETAESP